MRNYLFIAMLSPPILASAQHIELDTTDGQLRLDTANATHYHYNYGQIAQGSPGRRNFRVYNAGDQPLVLESAQASFGVPYFQHEPILPKQYGTVGYMYDTRRLGIFHKTLTIRSNDAQNRILIIRIKGEVLPPEIGTDFENKSAPNGVKLKN